MKPCIEPHCHNQTRKYAARCPEHSLNRAGRGGMYHLTEKAEELLVKWEKEAPGA